MTLFLNKKYTPDIYNSHTVLYMRALTKNIGYNELGHNEQSILRSLRVRYNEVLLLYDQTGFPVIACKLSLVMELSFEILQTPFWKGM